MRGSASGASSFRREQQFHDYLLRDAGLSALAVGAGVPACDPTWDPAIAERLAVVLWAARMVIFASQSKLDNPAGGPKGRGGKAVQAVAAPGFEKVTGTAPSTVDPATRKGIATDLSCEAGLGRDPRRVTSVTVLH